MERGRRVCMPVEELERILLRFDRILNTSREITLRNGELLDHYHSLAVR